MILSSTYNDIIIGRPVADCFTYIQLSLMRDLNPIVTINACSNFHQFLGACLVPYRDLINLYTNRREFLLLCILLSFGAVMNPGHCSMYTDSFISAFKKAVQ